MADRNKKQGRSRSPASVPEAGPPPEAMKTEEGGEQVVVNDFTVNREKVGNSAPK